MQELETESSWQEYVALMTERPELFREEGWLTIEKDPEVIRRYEQKSNGAERCDCVCSGF